MPSHALKARLSGVIALLLVVASLQLPWWPSGFEDRAFWAYRRDFLDDFQSRAWHNAFFTSWFRVGCFLQIVSVVVAAVVASTSRAWRWIAGIAVLCCLWQLVAVRGATLIDTTFAPYLGPIAALALVFGILAVPVLRRTPAVQT